MIHLLYLVGLFHFAGAPHAARNNPDTLVIPLGGNCWGSYEKQSLTSDESAARPTHSGGHLTNDGIVGWTDKETSFTAWFRTSRTGMIRLWLNIPRALENCAISVELGGHSHRVSIPESSGGQNVDAGEWKLTDTGYHAIRLEGAGVDIKSIILDGSAVTGPTAYTPDNDGNFFYWGRRGPSVHLNYPYPKDIRVEWFYNELTVPVGQDVQGSYFMADGFSQGYFGMQVNSQTTRHILFSIWSPFKTDDPQAIPDSQKIVLLKKGEGVHTGEFGNEGSGGQSYLNYPWKAGNTYRFLVRARPDSLRHTTFTAWFYAPEDRRWRLIASWRRPGTTSWLTGLHSFLENFDPAYGDHQRSVLFGRQWVCDSNGRWIPLTQARFTGDNTARKGYRMDYAGGVKGDSFYLRNGGFFSDDTQLNQFFQRPASPGDKAPAINFQSLP